MLFDETAMSWPKTMKTWPSPVRTLFDKTDFLSVALSPGNTYVDANGSTTFMQLNFDATLKENVKTDETKVAGLIAGITAMLSGGEPQDDFIAQWLKGSKVSLSGRTVGLSGPIVFPVGSNETSIAAAEPEVAPDPESVQLHFKLVEFDVKKLQELNIDFLNADEVATDTSGKFSTTEVAYALISSMNRNSDASLALIDKMCGKGKPGKIGQILAEPVLTTVVDRPAGFVWGGNKLRCVPRVHHRPDADPIVVVNLEFSGELDWKTDITTSRPGVTNFLPIPSKNSESGTRSFLVLGAELVSGKPPAPVVAPQTARRPGVNKKLQ